MEPITLTVSSVGQITLPRKLRKLLGIEKGSKVDVEISEDKKTITLRRQKTFEEVMAELDEIDKKYPSPAPDPRSKYMTVGEMSLEGIKDIKGDTWV